MPLVPPTRKDENTGEPELTELLLGGRYAVCRPCSQVPVAPSSTADIVRASFRNVGAGERLGSVWCLTGHIAPTESLIPTLSEAIPEHWRTRLCRHSCRQLRLAAKP